MNPTGSRLTERVVGIEEHNILSIANNGEASLPLSLAQNRPRASWQKSPKFSLGQAPVLFIGGEAHMQTCPLKELVDAAGRPRPDACSTDGARRSEVPVRKQSNVDEVAFGTVASLGSDEKEYRCSGFIIFEAIRCFSSPAGITR